VKRPARVSAVQPVILEAEPEPLQIDLQRTAVVVIDMQNAFVSSGGFFNLMGMDVSETPKMVETINNVTRIARTRGVRVICIVHHHSPDLRETGGPNSGYWHKAHLHSYAEHPEWADKCFVSGTWGAEVVKGLEFKEEDIVVVKPRFSAFYGTYLDTILRTFDVKYLVFAGVATNICVEAAIRDASNLDYFPILISDATAPAGPPSSRDATIHNVTMCLGWVTTSVNFVKALTK
jgi:ureidoacrylate peracid hydrolase